MDQTFELVTEIRLPIAPPMPMRFGFILDMILDAGSLLFLDGLTLDRPLFQCHQLMVFRRG